MTSEQSSPIRFWRGRPTRLFLLAVICVAGVALIGRLTEPEDLGSSSQGGQLAGPASNAHSGEDGVVSAVPSTSAHRADAAQGDSVDDSSSTSELAVSDSVTPDVEVPDPQALRDELSAVAKEFQRARHAAAKQRIRDGLVFYSSTEGADGALAKPEETERVMYVYMTTADSAKHLVELTREEYPDLFDLADSRVSLREQVAKLQPAGSDRSATVFSK